MVNNSQVSIVYFLSRVFPRPGLELLTSPALLLLTKPGFWTLSCSHDILFSGSKGRYGLLLRTCFYQVQLSTRLPALSVATLQSIKLGKLVSQTVHGVNCVLLMRKWRPKVLQWLARTSQGCKQPYFRTTAMLCLHLGSWEEITAFCKQLQPY